MEITSITIDPSFYLQANQETSLIFGDGFRRWSVGVIILKNVHIWS